MGHMSGEYECSDDEPDVTDDIEDSSLSSSMSSVTSGSSSEHSYSPDICFPSCSSFCSSSSMTDFGSSFFSGGEVSGAMDWSTSSVSMLLPSSSLSPRIALHSISSSTVATVPGLVLSALALWMQQLVLCIATASH